MQQKLQDREQQCNDRAVELDTLAAELKKQSTELQDQVAEFQTKSADLQTRMAEFDVKQSKFEIDRNRWEESCQTRHTALTSWEEEIIRKSTQLESLQARIHAEQKALECQLAQREREREQWEAERSKRESSIEVSSTPGASAAGAALPSESEKMPVEISDILRRFGRDSDKPQKEEDASTAQAPVFPFFTGQDNAAEPTAELPPQKTAEHEKEESVDDYMVRLMERIRSAQGELASTPDKPYAPASSKSESAALPSENEPSQPAASIPAVTQSRETVELSPRTLAPEKQVDITLLRDLANYSAKNALGKHARGQMMQVMYSKLVVALIGGFTGIALLLVWQLWLTNNLTFFSAMMSFAVAVIYGVQYVLKTIELLISGSDNLDKIPRAHPKIDERKTPGDLTVMSHHGDTEVTE